MIQKFASPRLHVAPHGTAGFRCNVAKALAVVAAPLSGSFNTLQLSEAGNDFPNLAGSDNESSLKCRSLDWGQCASVNSPVSATSIIPKSGENLSEKSVFGKEAGSLSAKSRLSKLCQSTMLESETPQRGKIKSEQTHCVTSSSAHLEKAQSVESSASVNYLSDSVNATSSNSHRLQIEMSSDGQVLRCTDGRKDLPKSVKSGQLHSEVQSSCAGCAPCCCRRSSCCDSSPPPTIIVVPYPAAKLRSPPEPSKQLEPLTQASMCNTSTDGTNREELIASTNKSEVRTDRGLQTPLVASRSPDNAAPQMASVLEQLNVASLKSAIHSSTGASSQNGITQTTALATSENGESREAPSCLSIKHAMAAAVKSSVLPANTEVAKTNSAAYTQIAASPQLTQRAAPTILPGVAPVHAATADRQDVSSIVAAAIRPSIQLQTTRVAPSQNYIYHGVHNQSSAQQQQRRLIVQHQMPINQCLYSAPMNSTIRNITVPPHGGTKRLIVRVRKTTRRASG